MDYATTTGSTNWWIYLSYGPLPKYKGNSPANRINSLRTNQEFVRIMYYEEVYEALLQVLPKHQKVCLQRRAVEDFCFPCGRCISTARVFLRFAAYSPVKMPRRQKFYFHFTNRLHSPAPCGKLSNGFRNAAKGGAPWRRAQQKNDDETRLRGSP